MLSVLWSSVKWDDQTIFHCLKKLLLIDKMLGEVQCLSLGSFYINHWVPLATAVLPIPFRDESFSHVPRSWASRDKKWLTLIAPRLSVPDRPAKIPPILKVNPLFLNSENCLFPRFLWEFLSLAHSTPLHLMPAIILSDISIPNDVLSIPLPLFLSPLADLSPTSTLRWLEKTQTQPRKAIARTSVPKEQKKSGKLYSVCMHAFSVTQSVVSDSLWPRGL